ncbi:MAG: methyltransferase domain-containing protein [Deltaproteobacteria bacterium]|nr:methyltransferase domain-containing protein [Deltaproteobacteria bacterium]
MNPDLYAHWRATTLGKLTEQVELIAVRALAEPLAGARVLDVGTGDGSYAIEAAACGARVTAIDIDEDMLAAARRRAQAAGVRVHLVEGSAHALPFADDSFDLVIAVTVLCLAGNAPSALREMARVLAPGGRLVLGELSRMSVWAAERRVRAWVVGATTWQHATFWTRRGLRRLVRDAGLRVVDEKGAVYFPPVTTLARALVPFDGLLGRARAPGAAFIALAATKQMRA